MSTLRRQIFYSAIKRIHSTELFLMQKVLVVLFLLSVTSSLDAAITIDDFSAGPLDTTLTPANRSLILNQEGLPEAAVLAGIRRHVTVLDSPLISGSEARVLIVTVQETYSVTTNANLEAYNLIYGLRTLAEGTADQALNLDLTSFSGFRIDVVSSQLLAEATISFRSGVNEEGISASAHDIILLPASNTSYSVFLPFTPFLHSRVDFSDIDSITLSGDAPTGFDITIGGIFVVPEPSTAMLLVAASIAVMECRWRRRS